MSVLHLRNGAARRKASIGAFSAAFILSLIVSCTPATGILYILENETEVYNADHGLPKKSMISKVLTDGSSYFALGSYVYVADVPTGSFTHYGQSTDALNRTPIQNWAKMPNPTDNLSLISATVPTSSTTLYALFATNAGSSGGGIYSVGGVTNANAGQQTWTAVGTTGIPAGARLENLFSLGTNMILQISVPASGASGRVYSLWKYSAGSFTEITPQGAVNANTYLPFIDLRLQGANALLLKRNALYVSTDMSTFVQENVGSLPSDVSNGQPAPDPAFSCIAVDSTAGDWYIGSLKGFVMKKSSGVWSHSTSVSKNAAGTAYAISTIGYIHMLDAGVSSGHYDGPIVGTQASGMLYVANDLSLTSWQTMDGYSGSYIGTTLYQGGILDISVSANGYQLFVGTTNKGLYSAVFDGTPSTTSNPTTPGLQWSSE